jgi:hypothetical protein
MSLTKVTNSMIVGAFYNVLDFGAVANGTTDSTAAIQAAVDAALLTGGTVFLPTGYYQVTASINIGLPFYKDDNDLTFIVLRTQPIDDPTDISNQDLSNKTANVTKKRIDFVGEANTYIVADFAPTFNQPVVAYNLDNDSYDNTGKMANFSIITPNQVVGGVFDPNAPFVANKLVGVYAGRGCSVSEKLFFAGLDVGFLSNRAYWTTHRDMKSNRCGQGFNISAHNQALAQDLNAHTCGTGFVYDGQNGQLSVFGTENCDIDCWVLSADCCVIGPAYLEDVRTTGGVGAQAMRLGYATGGLHITHTTFQNILILCILGTAKKGWRFWSVADSVLETCRSYGSDYDVDTVSYGATNSCDFRVTDPKWTNDSVATGEWSPQIGDSDGNPFTPDIVVGRWSRVGNCVTATFSISWVDLGSANNTGLVVSLLPFPVVNATDLKQSATLGVVSGVDTSAGTKQVTAFAEYTGLPVGQILEFYHTSDNAAFTAIPANSCSTAGQISGTITYITSFV